MNFLGMDFGEMAAMGQKLVEFMDTAMKRLDSIDERLTAIEAKLEEPKNAD